MILVITRTLYATGVERKRYAVSLSQSVERRILNVMVSLQAIVYTINEIEERYMAVKIDAEYP